MSTLAPAVSLVLFVSASVVALASSVLLVRRLERLGARWRLSEATLGLLVALAADSPEIASALTASIRGQPSVGAGVVLGSNVFNLAALLGLGAVVAGRIGLHRRVVLLEGVTALWVAGVTIAVVVGGLAVAAGLTLVGVVVIVYVLLSTRVLARVAEICLPARLCRWINRALAEEEQELAAEFATVTPGPRDGSIVLLCVAVVVAASAVLEATASSLGGRLDLSSLIIGGVVLAAVTSLPNAVGAVLLASRGRGSATLSEAMNSNMLNVVVGLLIPATFVRLESSGASTLVAAFYGGLTLLAIFLAFSWKGLSRWAGALLILGYGVFLVLAATGSY